MLTLAPWLDKILERSLPDEIAAVCFNLYEDGGQNWSAEFVGAASFDPDDCDWACDEVFTTRDTPLRFVRDCSWEDVLEEAVNAVERYLEQGVHATRLKKYQAVAVGFVDGDLEIVYQKTP